MSIVRWRRLPARAASLSGPEPDAMTQVLLEGQPKQGASMQTLGIPSAVAQSASFAHSTQPRAPAEQTVWFPTEVASRELIEACAFHRDPSPKSMNPGSHAIARHIDHSSRCALHLLGRLSIYATADTGHENRGLVFLSGVPTTTEPAVNRS
jgi:hypothetical protein